MKISILTLISCQPGYKISRRLLDGPVRPRHHGLQVLNGFTTGKNGKGSYGRQ